MRKSLIVVNVVFLLAVALLSWRLADSIRQFDRENDINAIKFTQSDAQLNAAPQPLQFPRQYNAAEFASIAAQNIFSDTRSGPESEIPIVVEDAGLLNEKPVLIGTMMSENEILASVLMPNAPGTPSGRKQSRTLRVGDVYKGYTVTDISIDHLVLESGSRKEVIQLRNTTRQTQAGSKTTLIATRIVPFGGASPTVRTAATVAQNPRPVSSPAPKPAVAAVQPEQPPIQESREAVGTAKINPTVTQPQSRGRGVDTQTNIRVLNTPFGEVISYPP